MAVATFRGVHNASKSKIFIVLYHRLLIQGLSDGLGVKSLSLLSGVGYVYISSRVARWAKHGYISRRIGLDESSGRPVFVYVLLKKGIRYVEEIIPRDRLSEYISEIKSR